MSTAAVRPRMRSASGGNDLAAVDDGAGHQPAGSAAILLGNDRILGDVNQAAGQIPRIRRLQRGIGETFSGTVRRIEVFEDGEPLLEVRDDRRFDDLAGRLGHQPAHAGQLLDLRRRTARPGIRHHPHRVDRLARRGLPYHLQHFLGDLVGAPRPDVDHLVVFLALGDQTVLVLLLVLLDLVVSLGDEKTLGLRDDQIILAERNARLARLGEPEGHQPVAKDHRLLLPAVAIDLVDDVADLLLGQQRVDQIEPDRRVAGQDLRQQHAAGGRFDAAHHRVVIGIDGVIARLDPGMQRHGF